MSINSPRVTTSSLEPPQSIEPAGCSGDSRAGFAEKLTELFRRAGVAEFTPGRRMGQAREVARGGEQDGTANSTPSTHDDRDQDRAARTSARDDPKAEQDQPGHADTPGNRATIDS